MNNIDTRFNAISQILFLLDWHLWMVFKEYPILANDSASRKYQN